MGGAFGGKIDLFAHEYCACLLSMKAGRSVLIVASREEDLLKVPTWPTTLTEVKTGVKKDGTIVAQQFKVVNICGADPVAEWWSFRPGDSRASRRAANLKWDGYAVYTNNPGQMSPTRPRSSTRVTLPFSCSWT